MKTDAPVASMLDFNPTVGMVIEGAEPEDPDNEPWHVTMALAPSFAGPPLHVHPHQEEGFEVLSGVLDVCIDGQWRELGADERITVPAGTPHTIRNLHEEEVRALNTHTPALEFPSTWPGCTSWSAAAKSAPCPPRTDDR